MIKYGKKKSIYDRSRRGINHVSVQGIQKLALKVEEDKPSDLHANTSFHHATEAVTITHYTVEKFV